jgi:hypothetical protein
MPVAVNTDSASSLRAINFRRHEFENLIKDCGRPRAVSPLSQSPPGLRSQQILLSGLERSDIKKRPAKAGLFV